MAVEILFRPDSRLLGFSHDFSNFGAQPDPAFTIRTIPRDDALAGRADTTAAPHAPSTDTADAAQVGMPVPDEQAFVDDGGAGGSSPPPLTMTHGAETAPATPEQAPVEHAAADQGPLVPTPTGSSIGTADGAAIPQPGETLHPAAPAETGAAIGEGPLHDATTLGPLGTVSGAAPQVAGITDTAVALHALGSAVGAATDGLASTVHDTIAPTIAPAIDDVGAAADTTVSTTVAAASTVVGDATSTVNAAAAPLVHDDAGALSGSDPQAGVTTLVSLVSADNLFDLRQAGSDDHTQDSASSSIDHLIGGDSETSPLLGDTQHHDDSALSGIDTHHHDLVGGI